MDNDDFQGEFGPIKHFSLEELKNDRLVKRLQMEKKWAETDPSSGPSSAEPINRRAENTIGSNSEALHNENSSHLENAPKRRKTLPDGTRRYPMTLKVTGQEELAKEVARREQEKRLLEEQLRSQAASGTTLDQNGSTEEQQDLERQPPVLEEPIKEVTSEVSDPLKRFSGYVPSSGDVSKVRKAVLGQLLGRKADFSNLLLSPSLSEKYQEVHDMFERTIRDNEGHSALIIGPRSSGKSAIVERALKTLDSTYHGEFITIRLNANMHSDDKTALREIARQLDCSAKEEGGAQHEETDEVNSFEQRTITETFSNILSTLDQTAKSRYSGQQAVSIIFVIDDFEKFTSSSKQTLLYNLFDLSQSSSVPICVAGMSTKITTRELLEKRVRSRFSQRIISINRDLSLPTFWQNARLGLVVGEEVAGLLEDRNYALLWNEYVDTVFHSMLYGAVGSFLKRLAFQVFHTTKNYKEFNNHCVYAVSRVCETQAFPSDGDFEKYIAFQSSNSVQAIVSSLSTLELLLVIAAARWVAKVDLQVVNFNLAYREYEEMIKILNTNTVVSSSSFTDSSILANIRVNQKAWSAKVLRNSWEILYKLGILLDVMGNNELNAANTANKNYVIEENKMVQLDITLVELARIVDETSAFKSLTML